jgi:hypothetical protein
MACLRLSASEPLHRHVNVLQDAFQAAPDSAFTGDKLVIFGGNHARPIKFADRLPPDVMDYLQLTAHAALNPLTLVAAPLKNVSLAPSIKAGNASFDFLYQAGD